MRSVAICHSCMRPPSLSGGWCFSSCSLWVGAASTLSSSHLSSQVGGVYGCPPIGLMLLLIFPHPTSHPRQVVFGLQLPAPVGCHWFYSFLTAPPSPGWWCSQLFALAGGCCFCPLSIPPPIPGRWCSQLPALEGCCCFYSFLTPPVS